MKTIPRTAAYSEKAEALAKQYESVSFEDVHGDVLDLLPSPPARALDVGAGTGRDAAALAARGYQVTAIEPTAEFRVIGQSLHGNAAIVWLDDALPDLPGVQGSFDLILLSAVWMHLTTSERAQAMKRVSGLLRSKGVMVLSLRHGPIPEGRILFEVTPDETIALATAHGLQTIYSAERPGQFGQPGVFWSRLAFRRPT
jgi:SAM-dependent methyltransferase